MEKTHVPKAQPFSNRKPLSASPFSASGNRRRDFLFGPQRVHPLVALFSRSGAHSLTRVRITEAGRATQLKDSARIPFKSCKRQAWRFHSPASCGSACCGTHLLGLLEADRSFFTGSHPSTGTGALYGMMKEFSPPSTNQNVFNPNTGK